MRLSRAIIWPAVAATLVAWSLCADALTLGRARGAVLLGRPLQISVPISLEGGETEPCLQAELFQGDTRSGPVDLQLERSKDGSLVVRARSAAIIEEPVITMYLRVGCAQPFTRGYVLLAEQPQDIPNVPIVLAPSTALSAAASAPAATAAPAAAPEIVAPPGPALRAATELARASVDAEAAPARAPAAAMRRSSERPKPAAAPSEVRRSAKSAPPRPTHRNANDAATAPRGPRLKLEPIDTAVEQAPPLKLSTSISLPAAAASPQRAQAGATWQAPQTPTEEAAGKVQRSEAVDVEVRALREAVQRQGASITLLSEQLEKARSERNLFSIGVLVMAAGLAVGLLLLLWSRSREAAKSQARWRQMAAGSSEWSLEDLDLADRGETEVPVAPSELPPYVDSNWADPEAAERAHAREATPRGKPLGPGPISGFAESQAGGMRQPNAEELLDIKQKTEFFLAIGQLDRAIELLENQIHDFLGSSPLVWLDLLDICHRHGKREEYERFRDEFQATFNAKLPAFEAARADSEGLEGHPRALSRIMLLWPSRRVLKVIEESLFEPGAIPFDLHASHDLLLLYSIAREVVQQEETGPSAGEPESLKTSLNPPMAEAPRPAGTITEPVPLAALDEENPAADAPVAPDIDMSMWDALPPAPTQARPEHETDFAFDFEPKSRGGGR